MTRTIRLGVDDVMPAREAVFGHQGIPADAEVSARILRLHERAEEAFAGCARPVGIISELEPAAFASVFEGVGDNAEDALVGSLFPDADRLALYAATIGAAVRERIEALFDYHDFALGSMLDSIASQAADGAAEALAAWYHDHLVGQGVLAPDDAVMGYSPGYCGWYITGQRTLFEHLQPDRIGISLNGSCMMSPLKSVSGGIVPAKPNIHLFKPRFSYCPDCKQRPCIDRMQPLRAAARVV